MRYLIEIVFTVLLVTALVDGQQQGSHCTLKHIGRAGVCTPFANCESALQAASKGRLPQRCDLTDIESELVCCTKADCSPLRHVLLPPGFKAASYCIELAEKMHPCQETRTGWTRGDMCTLLTPVSKRVYYKSPITTAAEAPYFGYLGEGQRSAINWKAYPVSLVSDQWVLCSAFAIKQINTNKLLFVGLGGTVGHSSDDTYGVTTLYIHPLFKSSYSDVYNDIALIKLDRQVTFTDRIQPACLHTGRPIPDRGLVLTDYPGEKTSMERIWQVGCTKLIPAGKPYHPAGVNHDLQICTRPVNTSGKCEGWFDGAPLTIPVACTHLLVGLKSFYDTSPCTLAYTRISSYISWIEGFVWPDINFAS